MFVTQEFGKVPSGVVTVITQLCYEWPEDDRITILMNSAHWASDYFCSEFRTRSNIQYKIVPTWLMDDAIKHFMESFSVIPLKIIKLIGLSLAALQSICLRVWLTGWMKKNGVSGILSHNGGWPGGSLNRSVIHAGKRAGIKDRILVIHNTPFVPHNAIQRLFSNIKSKRIGKNALRIMTVSKACKNSLEESIPFDRSLDIIYNGIQTTSTDSSKTNIDIPIRGDRPVIGFIGELHPRKGVHVLLEALKMVQARYELLLVGNGDPTYTNKLKTIAGTLDQPVHFLGFRNDVQEIYKFIDLIVLPSLGFESFGMVIIEGMRAGIPVICSDFGGMKEVVENGKTGLVIPADDRKSLAAAIKQLLNDSQLRARMGEAGRIRMMEKFSSKTMTSKYYQLFHAD